MEAFPAEVRARGGWEGGVSVTSWHLEGEVGAGAVFRSGCRRQGTWGYGLTVFPGHGGVTQGFAAKLCPRVESGWGRLVQRGHRSFAKGPRGLTAGARGRGRVASRRMRCHGDACDVTPVGPQDLASRPSGWSHWEQNGHAIQKVGPQ